MKSYISIIVPVYNSDIYLRECLESICSQTLQDIEIICINDGSTDDSLEILKEFQNIDARIIIINQKNKGVSAARNSGLEIATGQHIGFVDSDDTIASTYYEMLLKEAKYSNAEAVYSRFIKSDFFRQELNKEQILNHLLPEFFKGDFYNSVCNKIFCRKIIKTNNLKFPVGITHGEDAQFNIEFLLQAKKIILVDHMGYNYREVAGSATRNIIGHPYLNRAVEVYQTDWSQILGNTISPVFLEELKKERFIKTVITLIYIYGNRGNILTDCQRLSHIHEIVNHPEVKNSFLDNQMVDQLKLEKYTRSVFKSIRKQNVLTLYLLTQYSYYRNL